MLPFAEIHNLSVSLGGKKILDNISFDWKKGMCLAVIGGTGSGKTTLLKSIKGTLFHHGIITLTEPRSQIGYISRQHYFTNRSNLSSFYYQQRFNSADSEDSLTVEEELSSIHAETTKVDMYLHDIGLYECKKSKLLSLSNGEHKRLQIVKALLKDPDALLLDSPFTGLDSNARNQLEELLLKLRKQGLPLLIVTGNSKLPKAVTHYAKLHSGKLTEIKPVEYYVPEQREYLSIDIDAIKQIDPYFPEEPFQYAVNMINTSIQYGDKIILDKLNWKVQKGERWNLSGHNGSGKSTILSLINGDNPQAFSQEIYLFDKRKGNGESIWDIKQKIGFVSPELHHYIEVGSNAFDLIASGLFDTMGLFRKLSERQIRIVNTWIDVLKLEPFKHRMFHSLSDGEQRKILLARALVKNPPLLVLDEPCQGLDDEATKEFLKVVDTICHTFDKTLIYVSHYDAEIPEIINKKLIVEKGRIIYSD